MRPRLPETSGAGAKITHMATRLFISFDFDHDQTLRVFLVGQAKNPDSPFEIADWSVKEAFTGDWQAKVSDRIRRVDQLAVICGHDTYTATGVSVELRIARELEKPYFLLRGYSSGFIKKPNAALTTDKVYDWTWPNLKRLIGGAR